jgi:hypothetical protein
LHIPYHGTGGDLDFKEIFDRHYFSNHHVEAKNLETMLERGFPGFECITYSSFPALLAAALDELCDDGARVCVTWDDQRLGSINAFFRATGRQEIIAWNEQARAGIDALKQKSVPGLAQYIHGALMKGDEVLGAFMDFSGCSSLLVSAGVFATANPPLAEKLRWSRSSYGRRAPASIKLAANGRFSEFQAHLLNAVLDEAERG